MVLKSETEQEIKSLKIRQGFFFFLGGLHLNLQFHPAELHHQSPFIQDGRVSSASQKGFDVSIEIFIPVLFANVAFRGGVWAVRCESSVTVRTLCKSLQFPRPPKIEVSFDLQGENLGKSRYMCPLRSSRATARLWSPCAKSNAGFWGGVGELHDWC